jgi:lipoprotein-anchoring transpeptidase ErfK/SrfK
VTTAHHAPTAQRAAGARAGLGLLAILVALLWAWTPTAAAAAEGTTPGDRPPTPPSTATGEWIANPLVPTVLRAHPGRGAIRLRITQRALESTTPPAWMVTGSATADDDVEWVRVQISSRPNGHVAWVSTEAIRLAQTPLYVRISLGSRTVRVYSSGHVVRKFRAVVGAPATPTPRGLFAIDSVVKQTHPRDFIGPWALHLTAHSTVLENFGGGPGRVAIHGRAGESFSDPLGTARSHGCVRVNNNDVEWLSRKLTAGTPVEIRR